MIGRLQRPPILIGLVVCIAVLAIYPASLKFGFHSEDFVFFRPFQAGDLWQVMTGRWFDAPGAPYFYRPLSVFVHALEFYLFGLNPFPIHLISVLIVAACGFLCGVYVMRESESPGLGVMAAAVYTLHPATTIAVGPWMANQYQGLATICALWALLLWRTRRDGPPRTWLPIALPLIMAGLFKENALMLPLVLVGAHWGMARWATGVRPPTRAAWIAAVGLFVAMNTWRIVMLGHIGGYGNETVWSALRELWRGPVYVLLTGREWTVANVTASVLVSAVTLGVGWLTLRRVPLAGVRVAIVGFSLIAWCSLPLAIVPSRARAYLVALGGALVLAVGAYQAWTHLRRARVVVAHGLLAVLMASLWTTSLARLQTYAPCSEWTRFGDLWVLGDMAPYLPPEFVPWLRQRIRTCRPDAQERIVDSLPVATWHLPSGDKTILVPERFARLQVRVRSEEASAEHPITINVGVNGRTVTPVVLHSREWIDVDIALAPSWWNRLRRGHRIDINAGNAHVEVVPETPSL